MHGSGRVLSYLILCISLVLPLAFRLGNSYGYPLEFTDSRGAHIVICKRPTRVVSLVPSITEIIFEIGAGDTVKGVTYHSKYPPEASLAEVVGGFMCPSVKAIRKLEPDLIFVSRWQRDVIRGFSNSSAIVVNLETDSISDSFKNMHLLGRIFNKTRQTKVLVGHLREELGLVAEKVQKIPISKRLRVIRLMGDNTVMTPGDGSFQNEMIRAAGGIPPKLGKKGHVVEITKEEWMRFNPQVIYGCYGDRKLARKMLCRPGWKDVDAVKNGKIFFFPCDLTCRASTRTGMFVQWLSAMLYHDYFSKDENLVLPQEIERFRSIGITLDYVKEAKVIYSRILDFLNKTLVIEFNEPMSVLSTLEGLKNSIEMVGNHFLPPPCWGMGHKDGYAKIRAKVYELLNMDEKRTSFLFTGVDMDNVVVIRKGFREMEVYALVTAGVKSNAMRMSADTGTYYEPGTINIIILSNMKLTPRAMARAIISATEAKTAALEDLDIRSTEDPRVNQATGTGTDNIIIVQGAGQAVKNAGGHSKMGELIAGAVYRGVQEAVFKQNGLKRDRNIFRRLEERDINIFELVDGACCLSKVAMVPAVEEVLLEPRYASFIEGAMALSDCYERGLMKDLEGFKIFCREIAEEIAGKKIKKMRQLVAYKTLPRVMDMALNALLNGVYAKLTISSNRLTQTFD